MSDIAAVKSADLRRRLRRLATEHRWDFEEAEGANHTRITLNGKMTTIGRHSTDLKTGTLRAILKQLGLMPSDLEN